ncbi:hypothetical protein FE257_002938 [Aspergillus nanangensis]|uniref:Uncharacterized protein n=1 Tax=Aspergillus nanangensis TaxID=2582783 RepID=A0AAD4GVR2_ASPNN|nr:hypothetical protein FE257_002938 [Aspergillus nanangensis]
MADHIQDTSHDHHIQDTSLDHHNHHHEHHHHHHDHHHHHHDRHHHPHDEPLPPRDIYHALPARWYQNSTNHLTYQTFPNSLDQQPRRTPWSARDILWNTIGVLLFVAVMCAVAAVANWPPSLGPW